MPLCVKGFGVEEMYGRRLSNAEFKPEERFTAKSEEVVLVLSSPFSIETLLTKPAALAAF